MKKKDIEHPKLYINFKNTMEGVIFFYYSNKLNNSGKRLIESYLNKEIDKFSNEELFKLNLIEYKKLTTYITRQERILKVYLKKGFNSKYEIVKESLKLMYKFKNNFESIINNES
tara:strand:- start:316 stop:660 length:345 start_codon:yes stop_codon:yes gene_type:complete